MHNIKRNKKVLEYLLPQLKRLKEDTSLSLFFEQNVVPFLSSSEVLEIAPKLKDIQPDIFDSDAVLIETLKIIGLMEASKDKKDFDKLKERREKLRNEKKDLTDFDKILKSMMKVPKPKDEKE